MKRENRIYLFIVFACCLLACATIGVPNTYGLFYQPLADLLSTGKANVTLHVSIAGLVTGFSSPLVAKATRKISYRFIIISGIALLTISGYVISVTRSLLLINLMGVLRGLGLACSSNVILTMLTGNWFADRRGTVTGLVMSFSGVIGALFSPIVSNLLTKHGFHYAYLFCALLILLFSLPSMLIPFKPEDIQMKPYGWNHEKKSSKDRYDGIYSFSFFQLAFLFLVFVSLLVICVTTLTSYLPSYAQSFGQSSATAASLLSASMIGNVLFKFLIGLSIDRFGVFVSFVFFMFLSMAGLSAIIFLPQNTGILLLAGVLYGSCYAVNKVAIPLCVRIFFGDDSYGEAYSLLSLTENIVRSAVITGIGFLYDSSGSYFLPFMNALFAGTIAALLILFFSRKRSGSIPSD